MTFAAGARGLKVWKLLGLRAATRRTARAVDDSAAGPALGDGRRAAAADPHPRRRPDAFFEPLDERNERWEELVDPSRLALLADRGRRAGREDGFPPFDEIIDGVDRVGRATSGRRRSSAPTSAAPPRTCRWVRRMLDASPNAMSTSPRGLGELGRQPYTARSSSSTSRPHRVRHGRRPGSAASYALRVPIPRDCDESFDYGDDERAPRQGRWQIHGLGLPDDVLRRSTRTTPAGSWDLPLSRISAIRPPAAATMPQRTPARLGYAGRDELLERGSRPGSAAEEVEIETQAPDGPAHRTIDLDRRRRRRGRSSGPYKGADGRWFREATANPAVAIHVDGQRLPRPRSPPPTPTRSSGSAPR